MTLDLFSPLDYLRVLKRDDIFFIGFFGTQSEKGGYVETVTRLIFVKDILLGLVFN